jgi:hypothetical protein
MMGITKSSLDARKARFNKNRKALGFVGALRNENGAIDLASIMVGVIVIGVIAGVIAATVFAVIPWAQDQAASQSLDAVVTAEAVAYAFAAEDGTAKYLSEADLAAYPDGTLLQESVNIVILLGTDGVDYDAYSLSATGTVFKTTSQDPTARAEIVAAGFAAEGIEIADATDVTNGDATVVGELIATPAA